MEVSVNKLIICLLLLTLTGCSLFRQEPVILETPKLNLSEPVLATLEPVDFIIITKENSGQIFKELEQKKAVPVLFGLTGQNYKSLSKNIDNIKNYIAIQKTIIKEYKKYYEEENASKEN